MCGVRKRGKGGSNRVTKEDRMGEWSGVQWSEEMGWSGMELEYQLVSFKLKPDADHVTVRSRGAHLVVAHLLDVQALVEVHLHTPVDGLFGHAHS